MIKKGISCEAIVTKIGQSGAKTIIIWKLWYSVADLRRRPKGAKAPPEEENSN